MHKPVNFNDEFVVDLTGVEAETAYAWGCEAGSFMCKDNIQMLGTHVVHTGNLMLIEMVVAQRGFVLEVTKTDEVTKRSVIKVDMPRKNAAVG